MDTEVITSGQVGSAWPWAQAELFHGLSDTDLESIAARLTVRPFGAGEILIRQGLWAGALFIIRAGIVQISLEVDEGGVASGPDAPTARVAPLRRLVSGDCFGEMSLITGTPPSATARALTDGEVWVLSQPDFLQLAMAHARLSFNINGILSERLLHTSRQQMAEAPAQVIVVIAEEQSYWLALAQHIARLTRRATLCIDLTPERIGRSTTTPTFTFGDLLAGRIRPGATTPEGARQDRVTSGGLTAVRGTGAAEEAGAGQVDLPAMLGRLGDDYHYSLILMPPGHPLLTTNLLTYATRVLVIGAVDGIGPLRATLAALPMPTNKDLLPDVNVVLTGAPFGMYLTVTVQDIMQAELGVPVRGLIPADPAQHAPALATVARWLVGQRIGWVLGAGGARGFAHLGAMSALRRARLPADCAAGSSVGAIIASGVSGLMPMTYVEAALTGGSHRVFRPTLPLHGILSSRALGNWFQRGDVFGHVLIENMPLPFAVSATDLAQGREVIIRRGPLWQATLASAAIPGIYPPVRIGQHLLVDGGVVNPVPVSVAELLGADIVVAVDLSEDLAPQQEADYDGAPPSRLPTLVDTILRSRDIVMAEIRAHTVGESAILIKPQVVRVSMRNFVEGKQYMSAGEEATEAILPRLKELLPWLNEPTDGEPVYPETLDPRFGTR